MSDPGAILTDEDHRRIAQEMHERWQSGGKKSRVVAPTG